MSADRNHRVMWQFFFALWNAGFQEGRRYDAEYAIVTNRLHDLRIGKATLNK